MLSNERLDKTLEANCKKYHALMAETIANRSELESEESEDDEGNSS